MISRTVLLLISMAVLAPAQQLPFQLQVTVGGNAVSVQNRSVLAISSAVGHAQIARVTATYSGTGRVTISQQPRLSGSGAFTARLIAIPPLTLDLGESFTFEIQFLPTNTALSTAQLILGFTETPTPANAATSIELSLQGTASSFALSYVLQTDQNAVPLSSGGTIPFPATLIRTTSQATLNLTNRGTAAGAVTGISISGSGFRLAGLPLLPVSVPPGQNLAVRVLYEPTGVNSDLGHITITFDTGPAVSLELEGSGSSPIFVYQILEATPPLTVPPGGTVSLPDTNVGETSSVVIRVSNAGNANGTVNSITLAGQVFQISDAPILPQTLAPDAGFTATLTFAPIRPGSFTGRLIVNADTLRLHGVGLGPQLTFSYLAAESKTTLGGSNSSVVFSPVMISHSAQIEFHVKNSGTLPASIANIGVGQVNSQFSLTGLPGLPWNLAPDGELLFTINFAPRALGFSNGTLQVDTTVIPLVGSGTQPPPLPAYTIIGPSGDTAPGAQLGIGLSLADSYPVAIAGTLALGVSADLPADPAVQFATGGRSVPFVIPAGSTDAIFGSHGTRVGLQTGTVAGTITMTPSFATQAGNVDLNPQTRTVLQFGIAPAPPVLTAVQLTNPTGNSLVIRVTGFSTTRTLNAWNVQFTTAPGVHMPTSQFSFDVHQIAAAWFRSVASQAFGGQFTMAIQFNFQGVELNGQPALNSIASIAVSVSSELGESNSLHSNIP